MTDDDGSAICLSESSLRHVIDTWLTALVEGLFFLMRGNMSQIAHVKGEVCTPTGQEAVDVSSNNNSVAQKQHEGALRGGIGTTTTQHAGQLYCHFYFYFLLNMN